MRLPWLLLALLVFLPSVHAHSAPGSAVALDFRASSIDAELRLPLSELAFGFHQPLEAEPATVVDRFRAPLADYLQQHFVPRAPDGRAWRIAVGAMHVALEEQPVDLVVQLTLRPPAGAPLRRFKLHYDVISHEVMNHVVMISVRSDPRHPPPAGEPELIGVMRSFLTELSVERAADGAADTARDRLAFDAPGARALWLLPTLALLVWVATRALRPLFLSR